ncbi:MAG: peptidase family M23 [Siphoviridae sp. ctpQM7]|nr:MAG: peptidase family M23 [Siphoviridae sp. ctpQM7]
MPSKPTRRAIQEQAELQKVQVPTSADIAKAQAGTLEYLRGVQKQQEQRGVLRGETPITAETIEDIQRQQEEGLAKAKGQVPPQSVPSSAGVIATAREKRLQEAGATPEQRAANAAALGGIMDSQSLAIERLKELTARKKAAEGQASSNIRPGETIADATARSMAATKEIETIEKQEEKMQEEERRRIEKSQLNTGARKEEAVLDGLLSAIPAESQWMIPIFRELSASQKSGEEEYKNLASVLMGGGEVKIGGKRVPVKGITEVYEDIGAKFQAMESNVATVMEKSQGFLDAMKEQTERQLESQKAIEIDRLQSDELLLRRDIEKKKRDAVDGKIIELAMKNRMGGDGAMREIAEAEQFYDQQLADLSSEVSRQKNALAVKFSGLYTETMNKYYSESINNLKDARATLQNIGLQSISSVEARRTAEKDVMTSLVEKTVTLRKDTAKEIRDWGKEMQQVIKDEKEYKRNVKRDALAFFGDAMSVDDDGVRREAFRVMGEAGFDMSGADPAALFMDDALKLMDVTKKQHAESLSDPWQFEDDPVSFEIAMRIKKAGIQLRGTGVERQDLVDAGFGALWRGKTKEAIDFADQLASIAIGGQAETRFIAQNAFLTDLDYLEDALRNVAKAGGERGIYAQFGEGLKKYIQQSQDPTFARLSADIANITQVELHERYGAALTKTEWGLAKVSFPMTGDTIGDALQKVASLRRITTTARRSMIDAQFGGGYTPKRRDIPEDRPQAYDDAWYEGQYDLSGEGARGGGEASAGEMILSLGRMTQKFDTPIASRERGGLYSSATVKKWGGRHNGIDVAVPPGTPIPSTVDGIVEYAAVEPGWGMTLVIRDTHGAKHRFSHLRSVPQSLTHGARVSMGMVIAHSGGERGARGAGNSTGPHIDYRISKNNVYLDPLSYHS